MTQVKDGTKHTTPRSQTRHLHPLRPQLLLSSLTTTIIQHSLLIYPFLSTHSMLPPLPIYRMHVDRDELNGPYKDVVESNVKKFLSESRFEDGDCLVFLPNMDKVVSLSSSCARIIGKELPEAFQNVEFLRLSNESTPKQQDLVITDRLTHDGVVKRKIIFATSVAERQFEFPRVRMVIISGRDELSYYDPLTRSTELKLVFCSKAQITSQSSRSGAMRVEVVQCMTQSRHDRLVSLPPRPLLRSDLASMLIRIYPFGLDPESVRWYTTPRKEQVDCALERLVDAGLLSCSDNGDKLVLNEKGKLAPGLELTPEMINIFCHACPRDGIVPEYAYDLMVLIALTSVSAPFVRLTPRANIGVGQSAPSRFTNPDSEHLTLIHMWIAWHSLYQARDDIDFCDEHALVQSTCIEIGDKVNALISRYENVHKVTLERSSQPKLTLADLRQCLLKCLPAQVAVLCDSDTQPSTPFSPAWRLVRDCVPGLNGRDLYISRESPFAETKPVFVAFSLLRAYRDLRHEKILYMDTITIIPDAEAEEWRRTVQTKVRVRSS